MSQPLCPVPRGSFATLLFCSAAASMLGSCTGFTNVFSSTTQGTLYALSGTGTSGTQDGNPEFATHNSPQAVSLSWDDRTLLVGDSGSNLLRAIDTFSGFARTIAGSAGSSSILDGDFQTARFANFHAMIRWPADPNVTLYLDSSHNVVRAIDFNAGVERVDTIAGKSGSTGSLGGNAIDATFNGPEDICFSADGSKLFIMDTGNHIVRALVGFTGKYRGSVNVLAGTGSAGTADGIGTSASFNSPCACAAQGEALFVADRGSNYLRLIDTVDGMVSTVLTSLGGPARLLLDLFSGSLLILETTSCRIRSLNLRSFAVSNFFGGSCTYSVSTYTSARFSGAKDFALSSKGTMLYIADTSNRRIRAARIPSSGQDFRLSSPSHTRTVWNVGSPSMINSSPYSHSTGNHFGYTVSADGDFTVVGQHSHHRAFVFYRHQGSTNGWAVQQSFTPGGNNCGLGNNVHGEYMSIGCYGWTSTWSNRGRVYYYHRDGGSWTNVYTFSGGNSNNQYWGYHSGDIWGRWTLPCGHGSLQCKFIERDAAGAWSEIHTFSSSHGGYGRSARLHDEWAVVAAPEADVSTSNDGRVYIYRKSGQSSWAYHSLVSGTPCSGCYLGYGLTITDRHFAADEHGYSSGRGRVFIWAWRAGSWTRIKTIDSQYSQSQMYYGYWAVSMDHDILVIPARDDNRVTTDGGSADLYYRNACSDGVLGCNDNWGYVKTFSSWASISTSTTRRFGQGAAVTAGRIEIGTGHSSYRGFVFRFDMPREGLRKDPIFHDTMLSVSGWSSNDEFGSSVALSPDGRVALVGSPGADSSGIDRGKVYVFDRRSNVQDWSLRQSLEADDSSNYLEFGKSVAVNYAPNFHRYIMAVGAPNHRHGSSSHDYAGMIYLFEMYSLKGEITFSQSTKLSAGDGAQQNAQLGYSVAAAESFVVAGAPYNTHSSLTEAGAAYIFEKNLLGWTFVQKLTASSPFTQSHSEFGRSVAVYGNTIVIGAPKNPSGSAISGSVDAGAVFVFEKSYPDSASVSNWRLKQRLYPSDGVVEDRFGFSVAIGPNVIAVGAPYAREADAYDAGRAYIYTLQTFPSICQAHRNFVLSDILSPPNPQAGHLFGHSIALPSNGLHVAISAVGHDVTQYRPDGDVQIFDPSTQMPDVGAVFLFKRGMQSGNQTTYKFRSLNTHSEPYVGQRWGTTIASSSTGTVIVGCAKCMNSDSASVRSGSSSVFETARTNVSLRQDSVKMINDQSQPGTSCYDLLLDGHTSSGMYWMLPREHGGDAFPIYCDMNMYGGGWSMCYTTKSSVVDMQNDYGYLNQYQFGEDHYRADCRNIFFNEILFMRQDSGNNAHRESIGGIDAVRFEYTGSDVLRLSESSLSGTMMGLGGWPAFSSDASIGKYLWKAYAPYLMEEQFYMLVCGNNQRTGGIVMASRVDDCIPSCDNLCNATTFSSPFGFRPWFGVQTSDVDPYRGDLENNSTISSSFSSSPYNLPTKNAFVSVGMRSTVCDNGQQRSGGSCQGPQPCLNIGYNHNCHSNAVCHEKGPSPGFRCECQAGYSGDGVSSCVDIDECSTGCHTCSSSQGCINTAGSFTCVTASHSGASWSTPSNINLGTATYGHRAVLFGGKVLMSGGYTSTYIDNVVSYTYGGSWSTVDSSPEFGNRMFHAMVVFKNKLFVVGGFNGGYLRDVWTSLDGTNWEKIIGTAGWSARAWSAHQGIVQWRDQLWLVGGHNGNTAYNDVWMSPDGVEWTQTNNNAFTGRIGAAVIGLKDKLFYIGGSTTLAGGTFVNTVYSTSDGVQWSTVTPASSTFSARKDVMVAVSGGSAYIMGGQTSSDYVNDIWATADFQSFTQVTSSATWSKRSQSALVAGLNGLHFVIVGGRSSSALSSSYQSAS